MKPLRVLVVAPQAVIRLGLAAMLAAHGDFALVGVAVDGAQALANLAPLRPDLLLIGADLPDMPTAALVAAAAAAHATLGFALLGGPPRDAPRPQSAAGTHRLAVLPVDASVDGLGQVLRQLAGLRQRSAPVVGVDVAASGVTPGLIRNPLTQREHELLMLMGTGLSNQQIGVRLAIAMPTVKFHVTHILRKLGAENRTEAVLQALRHGLVDLR